MLTLPPHRAPGPSLLGGTVAAAALLAGALAAAGPAAAAPKASEGFQASVRVGYAYPVGDVSDFDGSAISNSLINQIPFTVTAGYKPGKHLFVGGYFTYAPSGAGALFEEPCRTADCAFHTLRCGAELNVFILPDGVVDPWLGYALGYEASWWTIEDGGEQLEYRLDGLQFGHLLLGLDYRFHRLLGLGPFADLALGTYLRRSIETPRYAWDDADQGNRSVHLWITVGLRAAVLP